MSSALAVRRQSLSGNRKPQKRQARIALEGAKAQRVEFLRRSTAVDRLERETQDIRKEADAMRAAISEANAAHAQERLQEIHRLNGLFPDGPPHPSPELDALFEQVTTALEAWNTSPKPVEPVGLTVDELTQLVEDTERQLAAKRAAVAKKEADEALVRFRRARELSARFPEGPPRTSAREELLAGRVRDTLKELESLPNPREPVGQSAVEIREELEDFDARMNAARSALGGRRLLLLTLLGIAAAVGIAVALTIPDFLIFGVGIMAIAAAGGIAVLLAARPRAQDQLFADASRRMIEQRLNARIDEERNYRDDLLQRDAVLIRLHEIAEECGENAFDQQSAVRVLRDWLEARESRLREREELASLWDELQGLLGGQPLTAIEDRC